MGRVEIRQVVTYLKDLEKGLVERDVITIKRVLGLLARVALSLLFVGIFYTVWMTIAIPAFKSGFGGLIGP